MNLAQDFSPGTALSANNLVPEARLSPYSRYSSWKSWSGNAARRRQGVWPMRINLVIVRSLAGSLGFRQVGFNAGLAGVKDPVGSD